MKKVSELIASYLASRGISDIFGMIGAGNADIFDSIGRNSAPNIVCIHHEQAATMAMQTYYRMTGHPTVALVTTGGGSVNAVTGVASAWMDSLAGVVISGNENSRFTRADNPLRIWGVQGFDSVEMIQGLTKYAVRVTEPERALYELEKAFHISTAGKPGPCWVDIPMNIQTTLVDPDKMLHFDPREMDAPEADLSGVAGQALALIRAAKRPVLWLGNGIRSAGAADQVLALVEKLNMPTLVSWAGIDLVDSDHPLVYGRAGLYGQRCGNFVLQNSDLVLAIGTRLAIPQIGYVLDEFAREAKLIVVDIDKDEVGKHGARVDLAVNADAGAFMRALQDALSNEGVARQDAWTEQCDIYRRRYPWIGPEHADSPPFINSYPFMERLVAHFKPDQVVVTDMGTALLAGHQVLKFKEGQRLLTSTGLGEMGFGLPGAIGASFARGGGEVMCLNCDGGMMLNLQELQTVAHHRLPIKIFVFNNDGYLMIKHTQNNLFSGRHYAVDRMTGVSCPDFSALAQVFGMEAYQIHSWEDFDRVIPQVQAAEGPVICEVFMHPTQLFLPKLSSARLADGTIVSPPLEDLAPLLPRDELRENMIVGLHPKSASL